MKCDIVFLQDWNTFLEKMSHLKFCVSHNTTSYNLSTPPVKFGDLSAGAAIDSITDKLVDGKKLEISGLSKRTATDDEAFTGGLRGSSHGRERTDPTSPTDETTWAQVVDPGFRDGRM